jgi:hypothetical protein
MGLIRAGLRLPLTPLDPRHARRLESALAAARIPAAVSRAVS